MKRWEMSRAEIEALPEQARADLLLINNAEQEAEHRKRAPAGRR